MKPIRRAFALLLVVTMLLSLMLPALAAEDEPGARLEETTAVSDTESEDSPEETAPPPTDPADEALPTEAETQLPSDGEEETEFPTEVPDPTEPTETEQPTQDTESQDTESSDPISIGTLEPVSPVIAAPQATPRKGYQIGYGREFTNTNFMLGHVMRNFLYAQTGNPKQFAYFNVHRLVYCDENGKDITDSSHPQKWAYCVLPHLQADTTHSVFYFSDKKDFDIRKFWNNMGAGIEYVNSTMRRAVALALACGYPNNPNMVQLVKNHGNTTDAQYQAAAATQLIIWEIVCNQRYATPEYSYAAKPKSAIMGYDTAGEGGWFVQWSTRTIEGISKTQYPIMHEIYNAIEKAMAQLDKKPTGFAATPSAAKTFSLKYQTSGSYAGKYVADIDVGSEEMVDSYIYTDGVNGLTAKKKSTDTGKTADKKVLRLIATQEAASTIGSGRTMKAVNKYAILYDTAKVNFENCEFWFGGSVNDPWGSDGSGVSPVQPVVVPLKQDIDPLPAYYKLEIEKSGSASITKVYADDADTPNNRTFRIYEGYTNYSNGNVFATLNTADSDTANVQNLVPGVWYYIAEDIPADCRKTPTWSVESGSVTEWKTSSSAKDGTVLLIKPKANTQAKITCENFLFSGGTAKKTSESANVDGFRFKFYSYNGNSAVYGISDESGDIYITDENYTEVEESKRTYTFDNFQDGVWRTDRWKFLAALETLTEQQFNEGLRPVKWRVRIGSKDGSTVFDKTYTYPENIVTDANNANTYRIEVFSEETENPFTGLDGGGSITMEITNEYPWKFQLVKKDATTNQNLSGAKFELTKGEESWDVTDNGDGTYTTKALPYGIYTLKETQAPNGYVRDEKEYTVTVDENGISCEGLKMENGMVVFLNTPNVGNVQIQKSSPDGKIEGITFAIYGSAEDAEDDNWFDEAQTDENGLLNFTDLTPGTYYIRERIEDGYDDSPKMSSPNAEWEQYDNSTIMVTLTYSHTKETPAIVEFENRPINVLRIIKKSANGNVSNISFEVYEDESDFQKGKNPQIYQTTEQVIDGEKVGVIEITSLKEQTYYIREVVPDGYDKNPAISVKNAEGRVRTSSSKNLDAAEVKLTYKNSSENPAVVEFTNQPLASLQVVKSSPDGNVEGFTFEFYSSEDECNDYEPFERLETDENGIINLKDLTPGTYYVREILQDGDGYDKTPAMSCKNAEWEMFGTNAMKFEITDSNNNDTPVILFFANKPLGSISIEKKNENKSAMKGVEFLLERMVVTEGTDGQTNQTWQEVSKATTNNRGIAIWNDLPTCEISFVDNVPEVHMITYRVTETKTIPGYQLLAEPCFVGTFSDESGWHYSLDFSVVDNRVIVMPPAGENGNMTTTTIAVCGMMACSVAGYALVRKKKTDASND